MAESFFATLQTELLDRSTWPTREGLAKLQRIARTAKEAGR